MPPARVPELDGIRGIAILVVLLFHSAFALGGTVTGVATDPLSRFLFHQSMLGWGGVDMFFVLSGFLITNILRKHRTDAHYFRHFYVRRVLRIFPLYYLAVLLFGLWFLPAGPVDFPTRAKLWLHYVLYVQNFAPFSLHFGLLPMEAVHLIEPLKPLDHFWSLAIEEQFYFVWPFLVWLLGSRTLIRLCVAAIIASPLARYFGGLHGWIPEITYKFTLLRLDGLAWGCMLALLGPQHRFTALLRAYPLAVSGGGLALIQAAAIATPDGPFPTSDGMRLAGNVGFNLVAVGLICSHQTFVAGLLCSAPLQFLGKYSYGLYVCHWPIMLALAEPVRSEPMLEGAPPLVVFAVHATIAGALSCACALLTWNLMEKHCLALKDRWAPTPPADVTAPPDATPPR
jgi:peptidoglycan/LPS O-acetylase OafA/YrhL